MGLWTELMMQTKKYQTYSIILLTENAQKRGLLAFPALVTWYTLARHLRSVRIRSALEGPPSNKASRVQETQLLGVHR